MLDPVDRTVSRIDPQADTVAQTIALGGQPSDLLLTAGSLWVADQGDGTVLRIDPATGRTKASPGPAGTRLAWPPRTEPCGWPPTGRGPWRGSTPGPAP